MTYLVTHLDNDLKGTSSVFNFDEVKDDDEALESLELAVGMLSEAIETESDEEHYNLKQTVATILDGVLVFLDDSE